MIIWHLELPFPPSVNHYYRHVGYRTLISREGRAYRKHVAALVAQRRLPCLCGRLQIQVDVYPPDNRERDLDNLWKSLLDSLQHAGVYYKDSQIDKETMERMSVRPGGAVVVRIGEYRRGKAAR